MPSKGDARLRQALTPADHATECEVQRLRDMSEGALLQNRISSSSISRISSTMYHADNADIIKRNTSQKKKKYLFLFPGTLSLPSSTKIGTLSGLNTRTPKLVIDVPNHGRMLLSGSLIFPKNPLITIRGPRKAGKPVEVVDTCETLVVFSEWAWIGNEDSNPGQIPEPVPENLRRKVEDATDLWKVQEDGTIEMNNVNKMIEDTTKRRRSSVVPCDESSEERSEEEMEQDEVNQSGSEREWKCKVEVKNISEEERRRSGRKRTRTVKYTLSSEDEFDDNGNEEQKKRRKQSERKLSESDFDYDEEDNFVE